MRWRQQILAFIQRSCAIGGSSSRMTRSAFRGQGQMKPERLEIAQLKREIAKLRAEQDILKKPRPTSRRNRHETRLHREAPGDLAGGMVVRGARCLAGWILCLPDTAAQRC
jgi:transposase-like protein